MVNAILIFIVCAAAHEAAHIKAGAIFGTKPEKLKLSPFALGLAMPGFDYLPLKQKLIICAAGPMVNLVVLILALLFQAETVFRINTALLVFNMLPFRTLDGGRMLWLILSRKLGFLRGSRAMRIADFTAFTFVFAAGIIQLLLFPPNISLLCLAAFLGRQVNLEAESSALRFTGDILTQSRLNTANRKEEAKLFPVSTPAKKLFDSLSYDVYSVFYLYDDDGHITVLTEAELINHIINPNH